MCGIVGGVGRENIVPKIIDSLRRLEYRGYDSAGMALFDGHKIRRIAATGQVENLIQKVDVNKVKSTTGIAHTRWATHGRISLENTHPHITNGKTAIVHNGIIENYQEIQQRLIKNGYKMQSETDSEVISCLLDHLLSNEGHNLISAVQEAKKYLKGVYAFAAINVKNKDEVVVARMKSPLVIGVSNSGTYIGSDNLSLINITNKFIFLEDGDTALITVDGAKVFDKNNKPCDRDIQTSHLSPFSVELGDNKHYMEKEIFEQSRAIGDTLLGRIAENSVYKNIFGVSEQKIFKKVEAVKIIACGGSYFSGLIARNWFEEYGMSCSVEISSEFTSRVAYIRPNTLVVVVSQSGETIDTLNAIEHARRYGALNFLAICNVPESSIVRQCELTLLTRAGPEISVASTKGFTTQIVSLLLLVVSLGRHKNMSAETEREIVKELRELPTKVDTVLQQFHSINAIANKIAHTKNALYLGRGVHFPIALEGALKLKEITYIHAEAYPAGELKHGPLALIDKDIPVIAIVPNNHLLEKLKSNIHEVQAREGNLFIITSHEANINDGNGLHLLRLPIAESIVSPVLYAIPLQLLAYHVGLINGTDIDKPRNLAKSVTVE